MEDESVAVLAAIEEALRPSNVAGISVGDIVDDIPGLDRDQIEAITKKLLEDGYVATDIPTFGPSVSRLTSRGWEVLRAKRGT